MCLLPHLNPLGFIHLGPLIQLHMAPVAQGRDAVIVSLESPAFAVPQLVAMSSHYSSVTHSAVLARQKSCGFQ
jgi:hypothetical protein